MTLSNAAIKKYIAGGGNHCPYCGSDDIEGRSFDADSGDAWQYVGCKACGKEWTDLYRLVSIEEEEK